MEITGQQISNYVCVTLIFFAAIGVSYYAGYTQGNEKGLSEGVSRGAQVEQQHTDLVRKFVASGATPLAVNQLQERLNEIQGFVYDGNIWGCRGFELENTNSTTVQGRWVTPGAIGTGNVTMFSICG